MSDKGGRGEYLQGVRAIITVQKFGPSGVLFHREDIEGITTGLLANYTGSIDSSGLILGRMEGDVTWTWPGHQDQPMTARWCATFDISRPNRPPALTKYHLGGLWDFGGGHPFKVIQASDEVEMVYVGTSRPDLEGKAFYRGRIAGNAIHGKSAFTTLPSGWVDDVGTIDDENHFHTGQGAQFSRMPAPAAIIEKAAIPAQRTVPEVSTASSSITAESAYIRPNGNNYIVVVNNSSRSAMTAYTVVLQDGFGRVKNRFFDTRMKSLPTIQAGAKFEQQVPELALARGKLLAAVFEDGSFFGPRGEVDNLMGRRESQLAAITAIRSVLCEVEASGDSDASAIALLESRKDEIVKTDSRAPKAQNLALTQYTDTLNSLRRGTALKEVIKNFTASASLLARDPVKDASGLPYIEPGRGLLTCAAIASARAAAPAKGTFLPKPSGRITSIPISLKIKSAVSELTRLEPSANAIYASFDKEVAIVEARRAKDERREADLKTHWPIDIEVVLVRAITARAAGGSAWASELETAVATIASAKGIPLSQIRAALLLLKDKDHGNPDQIREATERLERAIALTLDAAIDNALLSR